MTAWPGTWPTTPGACCSPCAPGAASLEALRKAGDQMSHEFLAAELGRRRPGDAVLSEEGRDDLARLDADRVWIMGPLDGTREFGEPGRTDWAVHVALWERRGYAGAVALPAQAAVLSTAGPPPRRRRRGRAGRSAWWSAGPGRLPSSTGWPSRSS